MRAISLFIIHISAAFVFFACGSTAASGAVAPGTRTYYVDAVNGNDAWSGTLANPQTNSDGPWRTFTPLNQDQFAPGTVIALRRGGVWREPLRFISGGTSNAPIQITAYGTGPRPVISGGARIPAGSVWTSMGGDVWSIVLGSTSTFTTGGPMVIRGPSGSNSARFNVLSLATSQSALVADQYVTLNLSGIRHLVWRAPAGAGQEPTNFDFEVSTIATPVKIQGSFVHLKNIDARLSIPGGSPAIVSIEAADSMLQGSDVRFSPGHGVRCHEVHRCVIRGVLAEKNHSTGIYIYGGGASTDSDAVNLSIKADDCIVENSISRNNGNNQLVGDRGGIGVERGRRAIIRGNRVMNNGNSADTDADTANDHAISIYKSPDVLVERNFINGSASGGIVNGADSVFSYGTIIRHNIITNWNLSNYVITPKASAIFVLGYGTDSTSGRHTIDNNTIFSDGGNRWLVGINANMSLNTYQMNDLRVRNNIVYIRNNTHAATAALRINRPVGNLINPIVNNNNVILESSLGSAYEIAATDYASAAAYNTDTGFQAAGLWQDMSPGFTAVTPAQPADFSLLSSSGNINSGIGVGTTTDFFGRPFVGLPDVGAIEYIPN